MKSMGRKRIKQRYRGKLCSSCVRTIVSLSARVASGAIRSEDVSLRYRSYVEAEAKKV